MRYLWKAFADRLCVLGYQSEVRSSMCCTGQPNNLDSSQGCHLSKEALQYLTMKCLKPSLNPKLNPDFNKEMLLTNETLLFLSTNWFCKIENLIAAKACVQILFTLETKSKK